MCQERNQRNNPPHNNFKIFLGLNLNRDTKDFYSRNLKTPKREIEINTSRWKNHLTFMYQQK